MELVLKCKASAKFVKKLEAGQVLTVLDLTLVKLIQRSTKLETSPALYSDLLKHIKTVLSRSVELYYRIGANVNLFDFDAQTKFNGYRSLQKLLVTCCRRILNLVIFLQNRKLDQTRFKEIKAWATLLEKLEIMLKMAAQLQARSLDKSTHDCGAEEVSLFVDLNELIDTDVEQQLFDLATIHQEAFFGRTCAFQFSKSLRLPLVAIVVAFTSFHDAHEQRLKTTRSRNNDGQFELRSFMRSMWYNGKKYVTNPELRSKRMCQIVQTTNVDLCKGFWQLTETLVFQVRQNV
jgi:hormone-sensitive lipase